MCTLIALHRRLPGAPLVVAANRDEFYDRPAEGLTLRQTNHGPIVTPRDLRAGGTWLGVNAFGVFAAVTNRAGDAPDPTRRSRGLLVAEALEAASAAEAVEALERGSLRAAAYNPFNLLVADGIRAFAITWADGGRRVELEPGIHVIGNVEMGEKTPKLERIATRVDRAAGEDAVLEALAEVCRGHDPADPLADACVHTPRFGTRSSTLLRLARDPAGSALRHADGPPCRAVYDDFTPLLRQLGQGAAGGGTRTRSLH